jgi:hypothetical protein
VSKENQPEKQAESPAQDDEVKTEQSGQEEYAPRTAQVPSTSATASASTSAGASASATASASPAYTGSASAPAPTRVRPEPGAGEQRGGEGMVAPAGPPARASGSQSLPETQAGPADATRLGDGVPDKVKKALDSAW